MKLCSLHKTHLLLIKTPCLFVNDVINFCKFCVEYLNMTNKFNVTRLLRKQVFTARCYASMVLACVSPSVCVCHKSAFHRNSWTNRAAFWHVSFLPPVLHCVKRKFGYLKNKGTSLWNTFLNSGLRKFCYGILIIEMCYQLRSRKVDAQVDDQLGCRWVN